MKNKASSQVVAAFHLGIARSLANDRTDGQTYWLHGNAIARFTQAQPVAWTARPPIQFNLCGHNTLLTRNRINQILAGSGKFIANQGGVPHLFGTDTPPGGQELPSTGWFGLTGKAVA